MKKGFLSAALLLCFLTAAALPAYGGDAKPSAEGLTNAIEKVKSVLNIDSDVWDDFTYNRYQSEQGLRWSLQWTQTANNDRRLSVNINEQGVILSYYYNSPQQAKGLAAVRQETAQQTAERFLQQAAASYADSLTLKQQDNQHQSSDTFSFVYQQSQDGIQVADGLVTVCVNKYSGAVTSFYVADSVNVTGLDWPDRRKAIRADQGRDALLSQIGVELAYLGCNDYNTGEYHVYPVYRLAKNHLVIDAFTGKAVPANAEQGPIYAKDTAEKGAGSNNATARNALSPKERAAVDQMAQLISQEEAARKLQQALGINGNTIKNSSLYTAYVDKERYVWQLELTDPEQPDSYLSGAVDAQTGQILSFYRYDASAQPLQTAQTKAAADQAVAELLAQLAPEELAQCKATPDETALPKDAEKTFNYRYERQANGIAFPENALTVTYDAALGQITSYQLDWYRTVDFPDISKVKTAEEIVDDMIQNADFRLLYQRDGQAYRLIYDFADQSAMRFDPFTGQRLDWQGQPYVAPVLPVYQWSGGVSEAGVRLLENGIYLDQNSLNCNAALTQQELAVLLYRSRYPYAETTDMKQVYHQLSVLGLIPQSEAAPDSIVTRQQAARYAMRLLGYERLLGYDKLFVYPYADEALRQYQTSVAIAGALGLLETGPGNTIRPTAAITLGETFDLLYKTLSQ